MKTNPLDFERNQMQARYIKTEIEPKSRTYREHYETCDMDNSKIVWVPVTRISLLYNPNGKPEFLYNGKLITDNDNLYCAIEKAIEIYADYTNCPECNRINRSVHTTLAACPGCGKIYEVKL